MGNKKTVPKRGTCVSRSTYQKVVEENRRLLADIYTMCKGKGVEGIKVKVKWTEKFDRDEELRILLIAAAKQYVKENPNSVTAQLSRTLGFKVSG